MQPIKKILFVAAVTAILAAGCAAAGNEAPTPPPVSDVPDTPATSEAVNTDNSETAATDSDDGRAYRFPLGNDMWFPTGYWVIDRHGNEVPDKELDANFPSSTDDLFDLDDIITGETRYRVRTHEELIRDEEGYPRTLRTRSLCDLDGNTILDWEKINYEPAFGEYIIRQDARDGIVSADEIPEDYHTALYHVPTGAESYVGTFNMMKLTDDTILLCETWNNALGVINTKGEIVSGFPMPKPYYSVNAWNGYIIASSQNPYEWNENSVRVMYLLDSNFNELYVFDSLNYGDNNIRGDYLIYEKGDEQGVFHPDKGTLFSVNGKLIRYYDGELAIVQTGRFYDENVDASLVTNDGKELASGYAALNPERYLYDFDDATHAQRFLGIKDNKAELLDRNGSVLASSQELPEMRSVSMLCDGLYDYYYVNEDGFNDYGLLGANLEIILPTGRYNSIRLVPGFYSGRDEEGCNTEEILLQASKNTDSNNYVPRYDILDRNGKVLVENVTEIYDSGPDRIALKRGFNIGLMDRNGNWIVKRSMFTNFDDD